MRWVTRERPHVDRCATAWLVAKFIDRGATFGFLAPGETPDEEDTPFDLPGVRYGHRGKLCTFEVALGEHGLDRDVALVAIAALVHDIDFHKSRLPESAGLDAILRGLALAEPDDKALLAKSAILFDALYAREKARSEAR